MKSLRMIVVALAFLTLTAGCSTPFLTELGDSSGCLVSSGGPVPGLSSGNVLVCRSGKDKAKVTYADPNRSITIEHE